MKLDVLGRSILQDIQKYSGFGNAVIAGGYCRDQLMDGRFKDVDIFVPALNIKDAKSFMKNLPDGWTLVDRREIDDLMSSGPRYEIIERVQEIYDFKYLDCIDVQVMNTKYKDLNDFGNQVVNDFSYGIDQAWSNGDEVRVTDLCNHDIAHNCASLVAKNLDIHTLPIHMKKFFRLQEKYPNIRFTCPKIEFKDKPEENLNGRLKQYNSIKSFGLGPDWRQEHRNLIEGVFVGEEVL